MFIMQVVIIYETDKQSYSIPGLKKLVGTLVLIQPLQPSRGSRFVREWSSQHSRKEKT